MFPVIWASRIDVSRWSSAWFVKAMATEKTVRICLLREVAPHTYWLNVAGKQYTKDLLPCEAL